MGPLGRTLKPDREGPEIGIVIDGERPRAPGRMGGFVPPSCWDCRAKQGENFSTYDRCRNRLSSCTNRLGARFPDVMDDSNSHYCIIVNKENKGEVNPQYYVSNVILSDDAGGPPKLPKFGTIDLKVPKMAVPVTRLSGLIRPYSLESVHASGMFPCASATICQ